MIPTSSRFDRSRNGSRDERLITLGATRVDVGQRDVPWVVLADPEGNEFCVLGEGTLAAIGDWGPAEDWSDWAETPR